MNSQMIESIKNLSTIKGTDFHLLIKDSIRKGANMTTGNTNELVNKLLLIRDTSKDVMQNELFKKASA